MKYIELNKFIKQFKIYDKQDYIYHINYILWTYWIEYFWKHIFIWNQDKRKSKSKNSFLYSMIDFHHIKTKTIIKQYR